MWWNDMMSGWGSGWGVWTMYAGMVVFWAVVVGLIIWIIKSLGSSRATSTVPVQAQENPIDLLKRRYAAGEIDAAEFEQKRRDLTS